MRKFTRWPQQQCVGAVPAPSTLPPLLARAHAARPLLPALGRARLLLLLPRVLRPLLLLLQPCLTALQERLL
jgi:hypothetical protein